jgi:lipopolysaccharide transport system permease protein
MEMKVIDAQARRWSLGLGEVWNRRELLRLLTVRAISTRYQQMVLGFFWSLLEPLALLAMMTFVFGFMLRAPSNGLPYPVFVFSGLLPWLLFSRATMSASGSLQEHMGLISKVYFPRLILPLSITAREVFDSLVMTACLVVIAAAFDYWPTWRILLLPALVLYIAMLSLGVGLWTASILVKFRDIRPLLSIALQFGLYASPIIYSGSAVPQSWLFFYQLNPMYWPIEASRWIFMGQPVEVTAAFYISATFGLVLFASGVFVFSIYEKLTVDVQ